MKKESIYKDKFVKILNKNWFVFDRKQFARIRDDWIMVSNVDWFDIIYWDWFVLYCTTRAEVIWYLALRGEIIVYC